jgi:hypothetical protein
MRLVSNKTTLPGRLQMNASELKYNVEQSNHDSHFFDRSSMKFSGDTMRNYGVRSAVIRTMYDAEGNYAGAEGVEMEVWELYRKRPVKHGLRDSAYFSKTNFNRVFVAK